MRKYTYGLALLIFCAQAEAGTPYAEPMTESYSQADLLKNWALSACLASVSKGSTDRADANATASAYMEFGQQPIEAYDQIRQLVAKYAARKYGGSIHAQFNTMKCIDLFHSPELDHLVSGLIKK